MGAEMTFRSFRNRWAGKRAGRFVPNIERRAVAYDSSNPAAGEVRLTRFCPACQSGSL